MQVTDKLEVIINDDRWQKEVKSAVKISEDVFRSAVSYLREHNELDFLPENMPISINLCLSNDEEVHKLNFAFRKKDKATNVLSFANIDDNNFLQNLQNFEVAGLGDIIIAIETMKREAEIENISFNDHYAHLLVHGILHLCGFDHIEDDEAEYMEDYEVRILKNLGVENPYENRDNPTNK